VVASCQYLQAKALRPPHIVASLLYESCLKVKANSLARLDKFEFVGLVKVICKPVVQFFRSIFNMKQMLRFCPIGRQTRVYVNLTVITFARPPLFVVPTLPRCKCYDHV
jgi:hypothetical protein